MLPLGMVLSVVAYGVTTYGYILVKGYNVTLRQWFSPLNPYTGSLSAAGTVPPGNLWPTTKSAPANATADSTGEVSAAPQKSPAKAIPQ